MGYRLAIDLKQGIIAGRWNGKGTRVERGSALQVEMSQ